MLSLADALADWHFDANPTQALAPGGGRVYALDYGGGSGGRRVVGRAGFVSFGTFSAVRGSSYLRAWDVDMQRRPTGNYRPAVDTTGSYRPKLFRMDRVRALADAPDPAAAALRRNLDWGAPPEGSEGSESGGDDGDGAGTVDDDGGAFQGLAALFNAELPDAEPASPTPASPTPASPVVTPVALRTRARLRAQRQDNAPVASRTRARARAQRR